MIAAIAVVLALQQDAPAVNERAAAAHAEGYQDHLGLGWEWLRVTGAMGVEVWHDDNILLSRDREESDVVTALVPELHLKAGGESLGGNLDYRGRARFFLDHRRFNGMEHAVEAEAHAKAGALRVEAWDRFQSRNDPFSTAARTDRIDWLQNDAGLTIAGALGRVRGELSGEHRLLEIADPAFDFFDHRRSQAFALAAWEFADRVEALAEVGFGDTTYRNRGIIDDYFVRWYAVGVRGFVRENIQVLVKAGVFHVTPDDASGAVDSDSGGGPYVAAAVRWQPLDASELRVDVQRRPIESILTGWTLVTRIDVSYTQRFLDRVTAGIGAFWEKLEDSGGSVDRRAQGASASIEYAVSRHLVVALRAEQRSKDSNDGTFDYDNRRASAGVTVSW